MGPKVPGAIAAKQGLFGTIRGWFGDAPAATPAEGEAVVFDMLDGRQGQGRWNFGSDHRDGARSRAAADRGYREYH